MITIAKTIEYLILKIKNPLKYSLCIRLNTMSIIVVVFDYVCVLAHYIWKPMLWLMLLKCTFFSKLRDLSPLRNMMM